MNTKWRWAMNRLSWWWGFLSVGWEIRYMPFTVESFAPEIQTDIEAVHWFRRVARLRGELLPDVNLSRGGKETEGAEDA